MPPHTILKGKYQLVILGAKPKYETLGISVGIDFFELHFITKAQKPKPNTKKKRKNPTNIKKKITRKTTQKNQRKYSLDRTYGTWQIKTVLAVNCSPHNR